MQRNKDSKKYKSSYNPNRECYISADGKYLCYVTTDLDTKRLVTLRFEIGRDGLTEELTFHIDDLNHGMDLNDRYESELRDPLFDAKVRSKADPDDEDAVNPWDTLADKSGSPEEALFVEPEPENPQVAQMRRVINEECTEAQQDFFFEHFGVGTQLEEMRQAEAEQTGRPPSSAAMTNRKNKIIDKAAKALGVERVKRHSYPKKDRQ